MKIVVEVKTVYGNQVIYPVCPMAKGFCELLNQKSLTPKDVEVIKKMGFAVEVKPQEIQF